MAEFKYPYFLLGTVVAGLWFAGDTYATQSPLTPGSSVGHRPVMTNLVLWTGKGPANGVITDSTARLSVGSTIQLRSAAGGPGGVDVDGDEDKAGAYCVWYKVPVGGGTPVLIQDNGPTDRNCQYTIQVSDVGFKVKADVTLFSDMDKALSKGYTINPIESIPSEVVSATPVVAPYFSAVRANRHDFDKGDGFPTIGFENARFLLVVNNGTGDRINSYYDWHTTDNTVASVSDAGEVNIKSPSPDEITIEAVPKTSGDKIVYKFQLRHWISQYSYSSWNPILISGAETYCNKQGGTLTPVNILTDANKPNVGGTRGKIGTLYGEWGQSTSPDFIYNALSSKWVHPQGGYSKVAVSGGGAIGYYNSSSPDYVMYTFCHIKL